MPDSRTRFTPPVVLTVAGSDCSSGAGAQADMKTITARGCYALTALTCVVSEVPGKVSKIKLLDKAIVADQIRVLDAAFPIAAVKTGMLGGRPQLEAVIAKLKPMTARGVPLVIDPVMVATSGTRLLPNDAVKLLTSRLFPLACLITPNLDEAGVLLNRRITTLDEMKLAAAELSARHGCAVLVKGGHLPGADVTDVLVSNGRLTLHKGRRIPGIKTHGTGCTYSAAITANLALGHGLPEAVRKAKRFVAAAIAGHFRWKKNKGEVFALNHQA